MRVHVSPTLVAPLQSARKWFTASSLTNRPWQADAANEEGAVKVERMSGVCVRVLAVFLATDALNAPSAT